MQRLHLTIREGRKLLLDQKATIHQSQWVREMHRSFCQALNSSLIILFGVYCTHEYKLYTRAVVHREASPLTFLQAQQMAGRQISWVGYTLDFFLSHGKSIYKIVVVRALVPSK